MAENKEFELRKALIELQVKADKDKHEMKMKELAFMRENDRMRHEQELERGRIKGAEIRKSQMRQFNRDPFKS